MPCIATCNRNRAGPPAVRRAAPHVPRSRVPVGPRVRRWAAHALAPPVVDRGSNSFLPCSSPQHVCRQGSFVVRRSALRRHVWQARPRHGSRPVGLPGAHEGPHRGEPRRPQPAGSGRPRPAPAGSDGLRPAQEGPQGPKEPAGAGRSRPEPAVRAPSTMFSGPGRCRPRGKDSPGRGSWPARATAVCLCWPRPCSKFGQRPMNEGN